MRAQRVLVTALLAGALLAACDRCGGAQKGALDAGVATAPEEKTPPTRLRATDLRSAITLIHPEFRYSRVSGEKTGVERTLRWPHDRPLAQTLKAPLEEKRFANVREEDGKVLADFPPFTFEASLREGEGEGEGQRDRVTFGLYLPLNDETSQKLYGVPAPIGSEHLLAMLPEVEGTAPLGDLFLMHLRYGARPDQASFTVRRLVEGLAETGWVTSSGLPVPKWEEKAADGGSDTVEHELDLALRHPEQGGEIVIERRVGRVRILYEQPLGVVGE